jgi:hypothetical protein
VIGRLIFGFPCGRNEHLHTIREEKRMHNPGLKQLLKWELVVLGTFFLVLLIVLLLFRAVVL